MKISEIIKSKKTFKIGYLGGSITAGSGASVEGNCWRCKFTKYLKEKYPETEIVEINASIGGTGSDLGLFRMKKDLLSKNPDIVFVEFAVNDYQKDNCQIYMENIVRNILLYNKNTIIVFVYTSTLTMFNDCYSKGILPHSVIAHDKVAEFYNIPALNMGKVLMDMLEKGEATKEDIWTDGVHPNDYGYSLYEDFLERNVENLEISINNRKESLTDRLYPDADLHLTSDMANDHWTLSDSNLFNRLPNYIYSSNPGDTIEFEFEGSVIGIYTTTEKTSGDFLYSIDDGEENICSTWDIYALQFARAHYYMLANDLEYGKHKLKITISEEKNEKSEGRYIRLGAFLVG